MVFGFGSSKKKSGPPQAQPAIRTQPSLPSVTATAQAIAWPSALVDEEEIKRFQSNPEVLEEGAPKSARKISFSQSSRNVPFHKPFRPYASTGPIGSEPATPYSAASPFNPTGPHHNRVSTFTSRSKRIKAAPTFNIMVLCPIALSSPLSLTWSAGCWSSWNGEDNLSPSVTGNSRHLTLSDTRPAFLPRVFLST